MPICSVLAVTDCNNTTIQLALDDQSELNISSGTNVQQYWQYIDSQVEYQEIKLDAHSSGYIDLQLVEQQPNAEHKFLFFDTYVQLIPASDTPNPTWCTTNPHCYVVPDNVIMKVQAGSLQFQDYNAKPLCACEKNEGSNFAIANINYSFATYQASISCADN